MGDLHACAPAGCAAGKDDGGPVEGGAGNRVLGDIVPVQAHARVSNSGEMVGGIVQGIGDIVPTRLDLLENRAFLHESAGHHFLIVLERPKMRIKTDIAGQLSADSEREIVLLDIGVEFPRAVARKPQTT